MNRSWRDIAPEDAREIDLSVDMSIDAPINELGERCPWPWEPQQLKGAPLGMYHCPYCGGMVLAGEPHTDYADVPPYPPATVDDIPDFL
jgi:hypothetical protein